MSSQAFAGRGTKLSYNPVVNPSTGFTDVAELRTIQFTGSKYDLADVTNMDSGNFREWLPTLADSGELSTSGNYIPSDLSQKDLTSFYNTARLVNWKVTLPNSLGVISFAGYVSSLERDLPVDKEAMVTIKIKITGPITIS
jgi:predicted secreted protein